ncbi:hypothetical protein Ciccas_003462 [Cichlidogyrus casuarinus]|uniref:Uncharacterized protein n=1 Tax=Cichlidogyrus casuarinus TaxID=1844966 RepID=A0ABD2QEH9_9PLAT
MKHVSELLGTIDIDGRAIVKATTLSEQTLTLTGKNGDLLQGSTIELKIKYTASAGGTSQQGASNSGQVTGSQPSGDQAPSGQPSGDQAPSGQASGGQAPDGKH